MRSTSLCEGQRMGWYWRITRMMTSDTATVGMCRPPQKIPKPPPPAFESGSKNTEGSGRSSSPPPDWIWVPLPPWIILRRVLYAIGRSSIIVLFVLQGGQRWRRLGRDGHWDWLRGGFRSFVGILSFQLLLPYCLRLQCCCHWQLSPSPGVACRDPSWSGGGQTPPPQYQIIRRQYTGFPPSQSRSFSNLRYRSRWCIPLPSPWYRHIEKVDNDGRGVLGVWLVGR